MTNEPSVEKIVAKLETEANADLDDNGRMTMPVHRLNGSATPGYWMNETSGKLEVIVWDYIEGKPLDAEGIAYLRAYIRQWIVAPVWRGVKIDVLRRSVDQLTTREAIGAWLADAESEGIDPL